MTTSWLKRPKAVLISSDHVALSHMTLAAPMINLASRNFYGLDQTSFFLRFDETFFLRFLWNFFFSETFFFTFLNETSLFFTFLAIGKLHLVNIHLANFIWQNFIWRRLATPIHSLASPGCTLGTPEELIFSNGWTNTPTNKHTLAQLYYR